MAYTSNKDSVTAISKELQSLKSLCANAYYVNENNDPIEIQTITPDNVHDKTLGYLEGLCTTIEKAKTPVIVDNNLLTIQALYELKEKTKQVEELIAFTRGELQDEDNEINRLKTQISIVNEAKSQPRQQKDVRPEYIQSARQKFVYMKTVLHDLIRSVFPKFPEAMPLLLGELMQAKDETSSGYIEIAQKDFHLIEILKDMNIVKKNPYNDMEVKLAY